MQNLYSLIRADREYDGVSRTVAEQCTAHTPLPVLVNGLTGGAVDAFFAESVRDSRAVSRVPVLVLCAAEAECERVAAWLSSVGLTVRIYPGREYIFHDISASHDAERERLSVLFSLCTGETDVVVTTGSAALSPTMPPDRLRALSLDIRLGDTLAPAALAARLVSLGFARVDMVESAGQFAVRGGIVDLFSDAGERPVRIEFFGDEIDRMGYFDPMTQRVTEVCDKLCLLPAAEVIVDDAARDAVAVAIKKRLATHPDAAVAERLQNELSVTTSGLPMDFRDKYIGLIYGKMQTLLCYFEEFSRAVVYINDTAGVKEETDKRYRLYKTEAEDMVREGSLSSTAAPCAGSAEDLSAFLAEQVTLHVNAFAGGVGTLRAAGLFGFRTRRPPSYGDSAVLLTEDLATLRRGGYRTVIVAESRQGAESLYSVLTGADVAVVPVYDREDFDFSGMTPGGVYLTAGELSAGFELITPRIAVLSMHRDSARALLRQRRRARMIKKTGGASQKLLSYADLSAGDYIVHEHYGIGLFEGIETVRADGITRDYIAIRYAGDDRLLVPCDRLDLIGKYIGARDKDGGVKLSRMGGTDWARAKSRAKGAVQNIAKELVALYAERQRRPGFAFPGDAAMESEFADTFPYDETDSQLSAIGEILSDMARPVPMNRLLCGDVGFGKTEVALRAAFRAVLAGKQVAFLVPTTILALQHYQTALSRMRGYAVTVEMLSRFRTAKEQAAILRRVRRGEVDILIGTHKLFSSQLEFHDLGLLIVDEEQRFGVSQKEKLKSIARNVDVLSLSATPIPRTLNMAMNGISDMSVLEEAPLDRKPVQTYVLAYDDAVIFDAIRRELDRRGQVLYLYNRVEDIDLVAGRLGKAFPEARVTWAHGQMDREDLEDIWQALVNGEIDILVCTTIIETGVDLPDANTLIIENADRMGLSQLHQLRGRVGRSVRQAYAYFTYRADKALSEVATKRLQAIREYAEFGAGYKIALRDLEIRGAGNLLGTEQHGYIDGVGYELYVRLLAEAVLEEKGELPPARQESTVDIRKSAYIPASYIPADAQRMEMYKKISLIGTDADRQDVTDELLDRFGEIPAETARLLDVALCRALASRASVKRVEERDGYLRFVLEKPDLAAWSEVLAAHRGLSFRQGNTPVLACRLTGRDDAVTVAVGMLLDYPVEPKKQENEK